MVIMMLLLSMMMMMMMMMMLMMMMLMMMTMLTIMMIIMIVIIVMMRMRMRMMNFSIMCTWKLSVLASEEQYASIKENSMTRRRPSLSLARESTRESRGNIANFS